MNALILTLLAAGPFPLPSIDGKALAVTDKQTTFRLPMRFERARAFYEQQFPPGKDQGVTAKVSGPPGQRVLALSTRRTGEQWTKASVREAEVETVVEVTPVMRLGPENVTGNGRPLVEFVISRSGDIDHAVKSIDHTESMRAK